jgi:hypothetical protein
MAGIGSATQSTGWPISSRWPPYPQALAHFAVLADAATNVRRLETRFAHFETPHRFGA